MIEFTDDDLAARLELPKEMDEGLSKTIRPGTMSYDYLTSYTIGPVQQGDFSLGLANRIWRVRVYNQDVFLAREKDDKTGFEPETLLTVLAFQPLESDAAFDQSANIFLCMEYNGRVWFYWFDPFLAAYTVTDFGVGRSPRCTLDQLTDRVDSDLHVFYIRENRLKYRVQRDRYAVEYDTSFVTPDTFYVEDAAITEGGRVVVLLAKIVAGHYQYEKSYSRLLPRTLEIEQWIARLAIQSGILHDLVLSVAPPGDVADFFNTVESWKAGLNIQSGILVVAVIIHTTFDIEQWKAGLNIQSGILVVAVITHTTFDIEEWKVGLNVQSGVIVVAVIVHNAFDIEEWKVGLNIVSGTLVVV